MSRLIDADALIKELNNRKIPYNADINDAIDKAPTVDAEPVIRCKDCKLFNAVSNEHFCINVDKRVEENEFCCWAERKEE